jgi:hypothetical protein
MVRRANKVFDFALFGLAIFDYSVSFFSFLNLNDK